MTLYLVLGTALEHPDEFLPQAVALSEKEAYAWAQEHYSKTCWYFRVRPVESAGRLTDLCQIRETLRSALGI